MMLCKYKIIWTRYSISFADKAVRTLLQVRHTIICWGKQLERIKKISSVYNLHNMYYKR